MENLAVKETLSAFWSGKKVFLTGHTGFKGCWLLLWLKALGAEIFGYSLEPQTPSLYGSAFPQDCMNGVYADIRCADALCREMRAFGPEIVFHLAAQPLVRESYRKPLATYETNVMGTVNLLEAVRSTGTVKSVVIVTTDKCYRDMDWVWGYRESDPLGGADPYSSSKACVELICDAWRNSYFHDTDTLMASARAGNVIGGGDWAQDRLVPDAIRAFQTGVPLTIRSPRSVRPWQHVMEPLRGYMMLAQRLYEGNRACTGAWNFGPSAEDSRNVSELAETLIRFWGIGASYEIAEDSSYHESYQLRLDSAKAAQTLGWRPQLDFSAGVFLAADWYRSTFDGDESPLSMTNAQISQYMEKFGKGDRYNERS